MVLVWCILTAVNGYFAWLNWPGPFCFLSLAFCIYSAVNLIKAVKAE